MVKAVVLRLLFFAGVLGFSWCENERVINVFIDNQLVSRNLSYVTKNSARLTCNPPMEKDGSYATKDLAIFKGEDSDRESVCTKSGPTANGCSFNSTSLWMDINKTDNYTCQYTKDPEPAIKASSVTVYFKDGRSMVDGDDIPVTDGSLQLSNSTSITLYCPKSDAVSSSDTKVNWYRNEKLMTFEHNPHYELNDTTNALTFKTTTGKSLDASRFGGWYRCERVSKQDGKVLTRAFIKVENNAHAAPAMKSYNKMEGESVTMSCDVEGEPVPVVTWKRSDKPLQDTANDNRITYSWYKGIANASITIKNLVAEDYGDYICEATSGNSRSEATILLRVRSKLAALWPFLGIVAEVIVLVAIIFIYEKRRAKKEQEETDDTADQKKSLTASNNENKDVRQRKA